MPADTKEFAVCVCVCVKNKKKDVDSRSVETPGEGTEGNFLNLSETLGDVTLAARENGDFGNNGSLEKLHQR